MTTCKLCGSNEKLEISHILPKFIFRYQKKTSPTGFIRTTENPNKTVQDGIKTEFLCGKCEDILSVWETKFANEIFYPYQNNPAVKIEYGKWLSKYLASVSFRVLSYHHHNNMLSHFDDEMLNCVPTAIDNLCNFILDKNPHPKEQRQLLILLDTLNPQTSTFISQDFNLYLSRAIDIDIITNDSDSFIYIKYLKFLQLCPIKLKTNKGWKTARINNSQGVLQPQNQELPDYVVHRLKKGAAMLEDSIGNVSENQAKIISNRTALIPIKKLLEYPIAEAIITDIQQQTLSK